MKQSFLLTKCRRSRITPIHCRIKRRGHLNEKYQKLLRRKLKENQNNEDIITRQENQQHQRKTPLYF